MISRSKLDPRVSFFPFFQQVCNERCRKETRRFRGLPDDAANFSLIHGVQWETEIHHLQETCLELVSPHASKGNWNDADCRDLRYPACNIPPTQAPGGKSTCYAFTHEKIAVIKLNKVAGCKSLLLVNSNAVVAEELLKKP